MTVRRVLTLNLDRVMKAVGEYPEVDDDEVLKMREGARLLSFLESGGRGMEMEEIVDLPDEAFFAASDVAQSGDDHAADRRDVYRGRILESMDAGVILSVARHLKESEKPPDPTVADEFV